MKIIVPITSKLTHENKVDVFQINYSLNNTSQSSLLFKNQINLYESQKRINKRIKLLLNIENVNFQLGKFPQNKIKIKKDEEFRFLNGSLSSDPHAYIPFKTKNLASHLKINDKFYINDEFTTFEVLAIHSSNEFIAKACNDGEIMQSAKIIIPKIFNETFKLLKNLQLDFIIFSKIQSIKDLEFFILEVNNQIDPKIIISIESSNEVDNIDQILNIADGILIARNKLIKTIPYEYLGLIQKKLIAKAKQKRKYSIISMDLQMFESVKDKLTSANILDITNATLDGTSAIIFSEKIEQNQYLEQIISAIKKTISTIKNY